MAFVKNDRKKLNHIRVICAHDPAVDMEATGEENWEKYREDPVKNEGLIKFHESQEPTIFVCNYELSAKEDAVIQDASIKSIDDEKRPQLAFGNWQLTVVKIVLKDIINPKGVKGIEMKKDSRGYASDQTLNELKAFGILGEIFSSYVTVTSDKQKIKAESKN